MALMSAFLRHKIGPKRLFATRAIEGAILIRHHLPLIKSPFIPLFQRGNLYISSLYQREERRDWF